MPSKSFGQTDALRARKSEGGLASDLAQVVNIWVEMLSDIMMARLFSRKLSRRDGVQNCLSSYRSYSTLNFT